MKHLKHCETSWNTSFDATISALDAETSTLDVETSAFGLDAETSSLDAERSSLDAETSSLDAETSAQTALGAETSALGAVTSAIARSYRRYRRGVSGNIGDCGVGVTPQMCNRVTNHGDISTFSKPESDSMTRTLGSPLLLLGTSDANLIWLTDTAWKGL